MPLYVKDGKSIVPPERESPGSPADWLARARSDLALAAIELPAGACYEDLCYHAQQAAEKAIKSVYRSLDLPFRFTHDLADLLNHLLVHGVEIPAVIRLSADLTEFAWQARYPSTAEPVTEADHRQALYLASEVVEWAAEIVNKSTR
jgi:HEPN domain-containing protein